MKNFSLGDYRSYSNIGLNGSLDHPSIRPMLMSRLREQHFSANEPEEKIEPLLKSVQM